MQTCTEPSGDVYKRQIDDSGYYSFQELNDSVYLFPFEYHVEKETIVSDDRFSISTFGGEISISLT